MQFCKVGHRPLAHHGNAANLEDKKKKNSLLGIEIYSHVKTSYCSVLQIGCIPTDMQGVYRRFPWPPCWMAVTFISFFQTENNCIVPATGWMLFILSFWTFQLRKWMHKLFYEFVFISAESPVVYRGDLKSLWNRNKNPV